VWAVITVRLSEKARARRHIAKGDDDICEIPLSEGLANDRGRRRPRVFYLSYSSILGSSAIEAKGMQRRRCTKSLLTVGNGVSLHTTVQGAFFLYFYARLEFTKSRAMSSIKHDIHTGLSPKTMIMQGVDG